MRNKVVEKNINIIFAFEKKPTTIKMFSCFFFYFGNFIFYKIINYQTKYYFLPKINLF